jgi:hypothetical protein
VPGTPPPPPGRRRCCGCHGALPYGWAPSAAVLGPDDGGDVCGLCLGAGGLVPAKTREARALPVVEFRLRPMVANVRFLKEPGVRTSYDRSSVPVMNTLPSLTQGSIECRSILAQEKSVRRPATQDWLKTQALMRLRSATTFSGPTARRASLRSLSEDLPSPGEADVYAEGRQRCARGLSASAGETSKKPRTAAERATIRGSSRASYQNRTDDLFITSETLYRLS